MDDVANDVTNDVIDFLQHVIDDVPSSFPVFNLYITFSYICHSTIIVYNII